MLLGWLCTFRGWLRAFRRRLRLLLPLQLLQKLFRTLHRGLVWLLGTWRSPLVRRLLHRAIVA
jgi:hypothetical protein